ncbi:uncharacterized protein SPPG_09363 [Spizellomyces punctatus DAOM BR117]|uniref:Uncharacterized protein n=1 Tax=Spizellomyces punctatus (strain DAOM BR117) TaxID=645134 RepID=A0A0L0HD98_SPIPD|nr:uncharacterized protein SPPG_09363 [Spizellomyces punctatus DAOM BR117]KNC98693.1 hypothetical protein SPPG_09363 [Spizellomyces punctatus DAOM BR117]|eukprot:XP_016606733.1 hypothetical protein SPPG_09363 [Spizellomyces punctatus DAOM BR117]
MLGFNPARTTPDSFVTLLLPDGCIRQYPYRPSSTTARDLLGIVWKDVEAFFVAEEMQERRKTRFDEDLRLAVVKSVGNGEIRTMEDLRVLSQAEVIIPPHARIARFLRPPPPPPSSPKSAQTPSQSSVSPHAVQLRVFHPAWTLRCSFRHTPGIPDNILTQLASLFDSDDDPPPSCLHRAANGRPVFEIYGAPFLSTVQVKHLLRTRFKIENGSYLLHEYRIISSDVAKSRMQVLGGIPMVRHEGPIEASLKDDLYYESRALQDNECPFLLSQQLSKQSPPDAPLDFYYLLTQALPPLPQPKVQPLQPVQSTSVSWLSFAFGWITKGCYENLEEEL